MSLKIKLIIENGFKMTKIKILGISLAMATALSFGGCGSSSSNDTSNTSNEGTIELTGDFNAGNNIALIDSFFSLFVTNAYALETSLVAKVVIFYANGQYEVYAVNDGKLSISVKKDSPSVLAFVDDSDNYLGYMAYGNGIDSLPINILKNDVSTIDLGILSSSGTIIEPENLDMNNINTWTEYFDTTEAMQNITATLDDFFANRAKNADMDKNGKVDILENKDYRIKSTYFINGGNFNSTTKITTLKSGDDLLNGYKLFFDSQDSNPPSSITYTFPDSSSITDDGSPKLRDGGENSYFSQFITNPKSPPSGEYTIGYNGVSLKFNLSNQNNFTDNVVLAKPIFEFDNLDNLIKITWSWQTPQGGSGSTLASKIIDDVQIQIDDNSHTRLYDSNKYSSTTTSATISNNISKSDIGTVYFAYNDTYGTHYVVTYTIDN